jgi:hypothetical protein
MTSIITCSLMKSVENEVKGPRFWRTKEMARIVPKRIPPREFYVVTRGHFGVLCGSVQTLFGCEDTRES